LDILNGQGGSNRNYDRLALGINGQRFTSHSQPVFTESQKASPALRNLIPAVILDHIFCQWEKGFERVAKKGSEQFLPTQSEVQGFRAMPLEQIITDIAHSTAPTHLQTAGLGAGAAAVAYARQLRSDVMQKVLHAPQLGGIANPIGHLQYNIESFNQASPYLFKPVNGGVNSFNLNMNMLSQMFGKSPFTSDMNILRGTGLVDDNLMRSISDGSGGHSYQPNPRDQFFATPAYQQFYGQGGGSLVGLINTVMTNDLRLVSGLV
jgi:hypothetical protein